MLRDEQGCSDLLCWVAPSPASCLPWCPALTCPCADSWPNHLSREYTGLLLYFFLPLLFTFFFLFNLIFLFFQSHARSQEGEPAGHQGRHEAKASISSSATSLETRKALRLLHCCCTLITLTQEYFPLQPFWGGRSPVGSSDEGSTRRKLLEDVARRKKWHQCAEVHLQPQVTWGDFPGL